MIGLGLLALVAMLGAIVVAAMRPRSEGAGAAVMVAMGLLPFVLVALFG